MAITLTLFRLQADSLLKAYDDELTQLGREWNVKAALERYSHDKPDIAYKDVTGDGGNYYAIAANLTSWSEGFSQVIKVEYPAATVASDEMPVYLDPEDWDDSYWDSSGVSPLRYLYLPNHAPAATEKIRIQYTAPYAWEASTTTEAVSQTAHGFAVSDYVYYDTVKWYKATDARLGTHIVTVKDTDTFTAALLQTSPDESDFFAICQLAAGLSAQAIADRYSRTTDTTISLDSVDHLSRAQQFAQRARELIEMYEKHLGLTAGEGAIMLPAGEFVDWDTAPGWPSNRDYLYHGKYTR